MFQIDYTFPQTVSSHFNILYYDNYSFPGGNTYAYTSTSSTKGLLTGNTTYVLGTSNALLGINYYDDEGRVAKVFKQHYQGGNVDIGNYDEINNTYNFEGILTACSRIHHNASGDITSIFNRYEYDLIRYITS